MCSSHPKGSQGRWQGQGSLGFHHSYLGIPRVFTWGPFSRPSETSPYLQVRLQILSSPLLTPQTSYQDPSLSDIWMSVSQLSILGHQSEIWILGSQPPVPGPQFL